MALNINVSKSVTERPFPEPSKEELEKMLRELIVRFDTSPKLYEKKDFGLLIKCIVSLFSFQGKQGEEIEKLLANNGRIVNGLEKPEEGSIYIEGQLYDENDKETYALLKSKMGFVFKHFNFLIFSMFFNSTYNLNINIWVTSFSICK